MNFWELTVNTDFMQKSGNIRYFRFSFSGPGTLDADWGDGNVSSLAAGNSLAHGYDVTGIGEQIYTIKFSGSGVTHWGNSWGSSNANYEESIIAVGPIGGLPDLQGLTIRRANHLEELPEGFLSAQAPYIRSLNFRENSGLKTIPQDLLHNVATGTSGINPYIQLTDLFRGSPIETDIPGDFLLTTMVSAGMGYMFSGSNMTKVHVDFLRNAAKDNPWQLGSRERLFSGAPIEEIVDSDKRPFFINNLPGATTPPVYDGVFAGAKLRQIPRNIMDGLFGVYSSGGSDPAGSANFSNVFSGMTELELAIPFWHRITHYLKRSNMYQGATSNANLPAYNVDYMPSAVGGHGISEPTPVKPSVEWIKTEGLTVTGEVTDEGSTPVLWRGVLWGSNSGTMEFNTRWATTYSDLEGGPGEFTVKVPYGAEQCKIFAVNMAGVTLSQAIPVLPSRPGQFMRFF